MIEALIWDYGGVLIHEDPADYDSIGRPLGFADGQLWAAAHAIPEYLPSRIGQISREQFEQAVRTRLYRSADRQAVDTAIEQIHNYYKVHASIRAPMQPLLAALKGRIKMALLSNAARGSTRRLEQRGLLAHVDTLICSGDVGIAKPDPHAYRLAARSLNAPVESCAFVDDMQVNADAALELGMQALVYHHARHEELIDALNRWGLLR